MFDIVRVTLKHLEGLSTLSPWVESPSVTLARPAASARCYLPARVVASWGTGNGEFYFFSADERGTNYVFALSAQYVGLSCFVGVFPPVAASMGGKKKTSGNFFKKIQTHLWV